MAPRDDVRMLARGLSLFTICGSAMHASGLSLREARDATPAFRAQRIINGTRVTNPSSKYSFHALPTASDQSDSWLGCGASIISPTYGMSAAHCFGGGNSPCSGAGTIALWMGDVSLSDNFDITPKKGGKNFRVEADVICHPQFDGKCSHGHDMVLLKLKDALPDWIKPVPLNLDPSATDVEDVGELTTDIGYGIAESDYNSKVIDEFVNSHTLRKVDLFVMADNTSECARVYEGGFGCSDEFSEGKATNLDQQLCAGASDFPERDTCSGDSGSPMLNSKGVQIGVVSYGGGPGEKMEGPGRICGDPDYPGVYTRVSAFKEFIQEHVKDLP